jgi:steroid Delta-isomerase
MPPFRSMNVLSAIVRNHERYPADASQKHDTREVRKTLAASQIGHTPRIFWDASRSERPARLASWRALDAISRKDKERYISLYAPNGVIHDPVGRSALDPTGSGHRGHDSLAKFWDEYIARIGGLSFRVHTSLATDNQVANSFTMIMQLPEGETNSLESIFIYRVDEAGLLLYVGGYWEMPEHQAGPEELRHVG